MTTHLPSLLKSRRLLLAAGALAAAAALPLAQTAQAGPAPPSVPTKVQVGAGHKVFLVGHAVGVQIYSCNVAADGGYAWGLLAPRADLFDGNGKRIMTHFGGPTWRANDGSSVKAARVDGVTVDSSAIPWLLLSTHTPLAGDDGDRLMQTTFIQRVNTVGGLAPAAGSCNAETVGTQSEKEYTADYYFWKQR